jgi:hypothetical protein
MENIDRIDRELLRGIAQCEGKPIIDYVKHLSGQRKIRTLYERITVLAENGLVRIDRGTEKKFCPVYITAAGKAIVAEGGAMSP